MQRVNMTAPTPTKQCVTLQNKQLFEIVEKEAKVRKLPSQFCPVIQQLSAVDMR
jgi:hypothetical protein